MALAYRTGSFVSAGNASGGNLTLTKPTGTVDGDRVVVVVYFESDTCVITVSNGPWETVLRANTGAFNFGVYTKIASSEPASYTISNDTAGNQWRAAAGAAYSGGTGSGTLIDISGGNQGDSQLETAATAPTVTTTGTNRMLVQAGGNFNGSSFTGANGAASNFRGQLGGAVGISDALRASSGATGTSNFTGQGTTDFSAIHVAIISDISGGSSSSDAGTGILALTASGADIAGYVDAGRAVIGITSSGADTGGNVDAGRTLFGLSASGADTFIAVDIGAGVIGLQSSGADTGASVDSGAGVSGLNASANDIFAGVDAGRAVIGLTAAADDIFAGVDTSAGVLELTASGSASSGGSSDTDAGTAVIGLVAGGTAAFIAVDAGAAIFEYTATATELPIFSDAGRAVLGLVASGDWTEATGGTAGKPDYVRQAGQEVAQLLDPARTQTTTAKQAGATVRGKGNKVA